MTAESEQYTRYSGRFKGMDNQPFGAHLKTFYILSAVRTAQSKVCARRVTSDSEERAAMQDSLFMGKTLHRDRMLSGKVSWGKECNIRSRRQSIRLKGHRSSACV